MSTARNHWKTEVKDQNGESVFKGNCSETSVKGKSETEIENKETEIGNNQKEAEIENQKDTNHDNNRVPSTALLTNSSTRSKPDSVISYTLTQTDLSTDDSAENCLNVIQSIPSKNSRKSLSSRVSSGYDVLGETSLVLNYISGNGKAGRNKYDTNSESNRLADDWSSFQPTTNLTPELSEHDQGNQTSHKLHVDSYRQNGSQTEKDQKENKKCLPDLSSWTFWNWGSSRKMMLSDKELNKMNKLMIQLRSQETNKSISKVKKQFSYELIIENERGLILFGYPLFNKNLLISNFDPPAFTNIFNEKVNISHSGTSTGSITYNMNLIPIANGSNWSWSWDKWHILMLNDDIDDQGWLYSGVSFHTKVNWRGKYRFGDNVRKRYWIRAKEAKISSKESQESKDVDKKLNDIKEPPKSKETQFFEKLEASSIDRFRIDLIVDEILKAPNGLLEECIISQKEDQTSEYKFFKRITKNLEFEQASMEILLTKLSKAKISQQENGTENVNKYIETFISFLIDELSLY